MAKMYAGTTLFKQERTALLVLYVPYLFKMRLYAKCPVQVPSM